MSETICLVTIEDAVLGALQGHIRQRAREIYEERIKGMEIDLDRAVQEAVNKTVVNLSRIVSFERDGLRIHITIEERAR